MTFASKKGPFEKKMHGFLKGFRLHWPDFLPYFLSRFVLFPFLPVMDTMHPCSPRPLPVRSLSLRMASNVAASDRGATKSLTLQRLARAEAPELKLVDTTPRCGKSDGPPYLRFSFDGFKTLKISTARASVFGRSVHSWHHVGMPDVHV